MEKRKLFIIVYVLFCFVLNLNAQSIKQQQQAKQRQEQQIKEQRERREQQERENKERELQRQAEREKGKLKFKDLLSLVRIQDVDSIDRYLTDRNWKLDKVEENIYTWSFQKNMYDNRAVAWFYVKRDEGLKNKISYLICDDDHREQMRKEVLSAGFKKYSPADAVGSGYESVYRNDTYEIGFIKQINDDEYGADYVFMVTLYDYKEIIEMLSFLAELQRQHAEAQKQFYDILALAKEYEDQKKYSQAKYYYEEALKQVDVIDDAEQQESFISKKISDMEEMEVFLKKRKNSFYDYETYNTSDYVTIDKSIQEQLRNILSSYAKNIEMAVVNVVYHIDTSGTTNSSIGCSNLSDIALKQRIETMFKGYKLKPVYDKGYSVAASATYRYSFSLENGSVSIKKTRKGVYFTDKSSMDLDVMATQILPTTAPYGKFAYNFQIIDIGKNEYITRNLKRYRGIGKGSCAIMSLLIPGLGDSRVSYGEKNGLGRTIPTYLFLGLAAVSKINSIEQYNKYQRATTQESMDVYFDNAQMLNIAFFTSAAIGLTIWTYDFFWVWSKGHQNKKDQKAFKRSGLSAFYVPQYSTPIINYSLNF